MSSIRKTVAQYWGKHTTSLILLTWRNNIKSSVNVIDSLLQLIDFCILEEMQLRRQFYKDRPHYIKPEDVESGGEVSDERKSFLFKDEVSVALHQHGVSNIVILRLRAQCDIFSCNTKNQLYGFL